MFRLSIITRIIATAIVATVAAHGQQIAFPGAEGYGKYSVGGRGGRVIEVTNLNDAGAGSLRDAINQTGPRTVVFRVSGTITLASPLQIKNPYITIAGQTAPGDGICLRRFPLTVQANHIIVRYLRVRLGDESGGDYDAMEGHNTGKKNIMIDHCSVSWSVDETLSPYGNDSLTIQWCLVSESMYNSNHIKGAHGYGGIWGGHWNTFHHNLLAHHSSRNPRFASGAGLNDYRNNVVYNWGFNSTYGGEARSPNADSVIFNFFNVNMVGNYYKAGPATKSGVRYKICGPSSRSGAYDAGKWYVAGNYVAGSPTVTANNWSGGVLPDAGLTTAMLKADQPFDTMPINEQTPQDAYESVLNSVGASLPKRDSVDLRIINDVRTGTAKYEGVTYRKAQNFPASAPITGIIDSQTDVGGWPLLASVPAPADADHDGMPDEWETAHGLNPNNATDRNTIGSDGYTNLEQYLNALAAGTATSVPAPSHLPESHLLLQNYPNPFNPSTSIEFTAPYSGYARLVVTDMLGREVALLHEGYVHAAERIRKTFDASGSASGIFIARVSQQGATSVRKLLFMK
ncbi:MAG TPA: T9SS type A sorting domain-containing protein [Bacteroidota bacterium]|nr:T9SS type A sorting domain-containing protein [Bacteroidota bacterium]